MPAWRPIVVAVAVGAVVAATAGEAKPRSDISPAEKRLVIQEAYHKLARLVAAGGEQIGFSISDHRDIGKAEFSTVYWEDLATVPEGVYIAMSREENRQAGELDAIVYRPKWREADLPLTASGQLLNLKTKVNYVLEVVSTRYPDIGRVETITSYLVTATFQERSIEYRAAVLWLPPSRQRNAALFFVDNVTQRLDDAAHELPFERSPRPEVSNAEEKAAYGTCASSVVTHPSGFSRQGSADHGWGSHRSSAEFQFVCRCDTRCVQTCEPHIVETECDDLGQLFNPPPGPVWFYLHRTAASPSTNAIDSGDGRQQTASCGAALGCAVKACLFGVCTPVVGIQWNGISASFQGDVGFGMSDSRGFLCPPCAEPADLPVFHDPKKPPIEVVLPPTEGGNGSGCFFWQTTCTVVDGDGQQQEIACWPIYCL